MGEGVLFRLHMQLWGEHQRMRIFRYWDDDTEPPGGEWLRQVIMGLHPDDELCDLRREHFMGDIPMGDSRYVSNYVRWYLMVCHGGVWLDHDVIPLCKLTEDDSPATALVGKRRTSCVMRMPDKHPFSFTMLEAITYDPDDVTNTSGDGLLNRICPVEFEAWALPFDSAGHRVHVDDPLWGIHLWQTSSKVALSPGRV